MELAAFWLEVGTTLMQDNTHICNVCQQRGGREDLYLVWPEVPSESTVALILVPATGLNGDGR